MLVTRETQERDTPLLLAKLSTLYRSVVLVALLA